MHNLLAEVITNLQNLAAVGDVPVDWEVSIHQAHPVLELMLDTLVEVTEDVEDIVKHLELRRTCEPSLPCQGLPPITPNATASDV